MNRLNKEFIHINEIENYESYASAQENRIRQEQLQAKVDSELNEIQLMPTKHDLNLDKISSGFEYAGKEFISKLHKDTISPYKLNRTIQLFNQRMTEISTFFSLIQVLSDVNIRKSFSEIRTLSKAEVDMIAASLFLDKIKENITILEELKKVISKENYIISHHLPILVENTSSLENYIKENISTPELTDSIQYLQSFLSFHQMKNEGFKLLLQSTDKAIAEYTKFIEFVLPQYLDFIQSIEMDTRIQKQIRNAAEKEKYKTILSRYLSNVEDSVGEMTIISGVVTAIFSPIFGMAVQQLLGSNLKPTTFLAQLIGFVVIMGGAMGYKASQKIVSPTLNYWLGILSIFYIGFICALAIDLSVIWRGIPEYLLFSLSFVLFVGVAFTLYWASTTGRKLRSLYTLSKTVFSKKK